MSESNNPRAASSQSPYQTLGTRLRTVRQRHKESVAEVSGAVEIDLSTLERFERGVELPSEDILMLLINHFNLADDEAVTLWELAGYDQHDMFCDHDHEFDDDRAVGNEPRLVKQPVVLLAMDARVVYSNGVEIVSDKNGVIVNFTQLVDASQGKLAVARVGMSYEQAGNLLESLQRTMLYGKFAEKGKLLPSPDIAPHGTDPLPHPKIAPGKKSNRKSTD
jgi:transcriptional regulator with XRE-family HTH domain